MLRFINEMKKFFYPIHRQRKNTTCISINGYISSCALVCFFILLQVTSLISLYLLDHAYLLEANKQSTIDLSCISYAKAMIQHNERIRQCHFDPKDLILEKSEVINDVFVTFRDENTFIDCTYEKKEKKVHMRIYYDTQGIFDMDFL